ncbi:conserved hypothetical protein [Candidatus Jettenia caeni]|uniref:Uncharacterized protein n=1 Tax=Candidatus Jettenia caeni TaxID=247490 RepID=I3IMR7_9BACT|nr:hypothetical protein [Candidatus Jettenia sp. AMX1]WKZ14768.1 MAG: hypothetical protein QY317_12775 [Candidatus Jettenia caeni]GAB63012.1 conserved hypothetical protein [Candidatus Jettenia caeni]GJQ44344.1 MAG: hypothetical protein JETCAE04_00980 [Candidatus Jettenia caeni]
MTKLLEKAFEEVAKLPEKEQNTFASWILEELASEQRWEKAFTDSQDKLAKLADEALAEHREG